ncbi:ATPase [Methylobacterium sp. E-041]|uniref:ATPase n=1 Tax=unclassified Methylobacterium TaxID=2615210 RepID=UPI0011CC728F|nr:MULTISPECIES: ATPase [unclassified Methylobacterium]MCJ2006977.1 ATPase [Methylobacterium sp. J-092]MCJ2040503.1 ATPase [Methylobacterium sp. J-059]MCJ2076837.1 ATPase [Methylobacterium sp. E-016]MCJ2109119.1 ATPase [Methylobacterium sp. E-041]MCJ2112330.1 ATPase [Methylobacterium sp. E-025]
MRKMPPSREVQRERRAWAIESDRWTHERHVEKGYRIKWGYVAIAYLVEFMVIGASLWGAWLFAAVYSDGDNHAFYFMLLAPLVYAAVELCRVPLGILARTQRSYFIRALAVVGIIFAAGVTTKSVSQLGEMMFHPRLMEASKTKTALKDAQADRSTIDNRIASADARVAQYTTELDQIEKRAADNAAQLSALPAQRCEKVFGTNSRGVRYQNLKCVTDPRTATLSSSVAKASADRGVLTKDLEEARKARAQLDRGAAERKVADAEQAYRNAVNRSQLHSFTAMVYGVDPIDVSEQQVHAFLRIFVFLPALCAAFASTILALCAVSVRKTFMDEDDLGAAVNPEATPYMLESITEALKQNLEPVLPRQNREAATGAVIPINRPATGIAPGIAAANQPNLPAASAGAGA